MSMRFSLEQLNPALRAQAEARLRGLPGTVIRGKIDGKGERTPPVPTHSPVQHSLHSKYRNKRCEWNGEKFDSLKEMERYGELLLLEKAGEIRSLERQVRFDLKVKGVLICAYVADFVYVRTDNDRKTIEDVKGYKGGGAHRVFRLKQQLMLAVHRVQVVTV